MMLPGGSLPISPATTPDGFDDLDARLSPVPSCLNGQPQDEPSLEGFAIFQNQSYEEEGDDVSSQEAAAEQFSSTQNGLFEVEPSTQSDESSPKLFTEAEVSELIRTKEIEWLQRCYALIEAYEFHKAVAAEKLDLLEARWMRQFAACSEAEQSNVHLKAELAKAERKLAEEMQARVASEEQCRELAKEKYSYHLLEAEHAELQREMQQVQVEAHRAADEKCHEMALDFAFQLEHLTQDADNELARLKEEHGKMAKRAAEAEMKCDRLSDRLDEYRCEAEYNRCKAKADECSAKLREIQASDSGNLVQTMAAKIMAENAGKENMQCNESLWGLGERYKAQKDTTPEVRDAVTRLQGLMGISENCPNPRPIRVSLRC